MCTSTRTLMSAVSIWPGSTWLTLWLEEATSDDGIPADDVGQGEDGGGGKEGPLGANKGPTWGQPEADGALYALGRASGGPRERRNV